MDIPASLAPDGIVLHVRLTPKSGSARVAGVESHGGKPILKAYVTAPPEDGKANAALSMLVAGWLGVPKSKVAVASGQKSRLKSVTVEGDGGALMTKVEALLAGLPNAKTHK